MNGFKKFVVAAVLAVAAVGGAAVIDSPLAGTQKAQAGSWRLERVYLGAVTERDGSLWVRFQGVTLFGGQMSGIIRVNGVRQSWTNSQRATEWVTLRPGTTEVVVDRRFSNQGRQLLFHCYQYRWVYR